MGSISKPIPPQIIYQDYAKELDARGMTDQTRRNRSFYLSAPPQKMTDKIVDEISMFLEE